MFCLIVVVKQKEATNGLLFYRGRAFRPDMSVNVGSDTNYVPPLSRRFVSVLTT